MKVASRSDAVVTVVELVQVWPLPDLGITKTHSRPHVSDDNPYSESQFKPLKYRPGFPSRYASMEEAHAFCQQFFPWYNTEHRHSGIGLLTPRPLADALFRTSGRVMVSQICHRLICTASGLMAEPRRMCVLSAPGSSLGSTHPARVRRVPSTPSLPGRGQSSSPPNPT